MLIITGSIINVISSSGGIWDYNAQDYNGDAVVNATDRLETNTIQCDSTKNHGSPPLTSFP